MVATKPLTDAERREKTIAFEMQYCQHYKSQPGKVWPECAVGEELPEKRSPCVKGHELSDPLALCPKWIRRTREQGEARADRMEASMARFRLVMPVVAEWRTKPPRGKREVIECPACKGRLHLSQASSNGHVHGQCETAGCVSWME